MANVWSSYGQNIFHTCKLAKHRQLTLRLMSLLNAPQP